MTTCTAEKERKTRFCPPDKSVFQTIKKARNRQNQNDKRGYLIPNQGFFPCHPERTRRIFAVSKEKRFFVTSFLRMTYKERFCCNSACFARVLTSIATRALPYLCTPTGVHRRRISLARQISQTPQGIYFVEKKQPLSFRQRLFLFCERAVKRCIK